MARIYTPDQLQELAGFVRWLIEASPYATDVDLARAANYPAPNLSKVKNGKMGVDGVNLLRLMRAAGVMPAGGTLTTREGVPGPRLADRREERAVELAEMLEESHQDLRLV